MTVRLLRIVADSFDEIDGELALTSGLDPLDLPLDRLLNLAYAWAIRPATHNPNVENPEQEVDRFRRRLWMPPAGEAGRGPWSAEAETAAFGAFAAQVQKKDPKNPTAPNTPTTPTAPG